MKVIGGGAVRGLVESLAPAFAAAHGIGIDGDFGAVGAMRSKLVAGEPADIVILTRAIMLELGGELRISADTLTDLGGVPTAVAVRRGDPQPSIEDADALRAALRDADAIYLPDPQQATAGIHFAAVIDRLGLASMVGSRLRPFPNGATAMRELAASTAARPIGCTQASEIIATSGVELIGNLPPGFGLVTVYSAAVTGSCPTPEAARKFIELLAAESSREHRRRCGFATG